MDGKIMTKIAVLVFGSPNSGKGTQARLLAKKYGLFQFTTSQIGKDYMRAHDDPETKKQQILYERGILFEPTWTLRVVKEKTQEIFDQGKSIVYDGSPRTLYEARGLYPLLTDLFGKDNIYVLELKIGEEEIRERSAKRLVCSNNSSHSFVAGEENVEVGAPCPEGDGILIKRDLDNEELFKTRMNEYRNRTVPGLEFIKSHHPVAEINGGQSIEKIHEDIVRAVGLK